jgi:predicted DNA-binding protein with PD1-like motif
MTAVVEEGSLGRTLVARIRPNEDLVESICNLCREHHFAQAVVRGGIGSLVNGEVLYGPDGERRRPIYGPAVEILSMSGEVRSNGQSGDYSASVHGVLGDPNGHVFAGRFTPGGNRVCVTVELVLQEWLPLSVGTADSVGEPAP